jgi:hypothetical protein
MVDCGAFVVACVVVKNVPRLSVFFWMLSREAVRCASGQGIRQRQQQIPFGNDNKKSNYGLKVRAVG